MMINNDTNIKGGGVFSGVCEPPLGHQPSSMVYSQKCGRQSRVNVTKLGFDKSEVVIESIEDLPAEDDRLSEETQVQIDEYWKGTLADCDFVPFPPVPLSRGPQLPDTVIDHEISYGETTANESTLRAIALAAWGIVVGQLTGSSDVIFGAAIMKPRQPKDINSFAQTPVVPIRIKLQSSLKLSDYLTTVQKQLVDMMPFERVGLHHIAQLSPDSQKACTFQTLIVVQPQNSGEGVNRVRDESRTKERQQWLKTYALVLELEPKTKSLNVRASFESESTDAWMVHNLLKRLDIVMQQFNDARPARTMKEVDVTSPQDVLQIWGWNKDVPNPLERCVHDMVQERATSQPTAPAICAWDGDVSYDELERLASQLAGRLIDSGFATNTTVPLCFEKSMWATVAMLGVLKAGGSFVLLDASLPEQRLQSITKQVNSKFILSSHLNTNLSSRLSQVVIEVSANTISSSNSIPKQPLIIQQPSAVMFTVFTSGSTGTPKGVVQSHTSFCSGLLHQSHLLGFTTNSRVFDYASYAFDISVHNNFATLVAGGCVCIPSDKDRQDDISKSMVDMKVTIADLTPSVARLIDPNTVPHLDTLILAGEAVSTADVARWWGKARVINAYGPAECNFSCIGWKQTCPEEIVRIGKGEGLVTWIVDPENHNSLLPIGCVGELLLEGPVVSLGYLNDPGKTEKVFIRDPKWLIRGAPGHKGRKGRVYKTGDLVRYNKDGSLTFVGRKDTQVKIRGQRVELGEIEYWVHQCVPRPTQVAVEAILPREETTGPVLVAFIQDFNGLDVSNHLESPGASIRPIPPSMQAKLAQHLPMHMIPAAFISMKELPLTLTGKTDRRALRQLGSSFSLLQLAESQTMLQGAKREPGSPEEKQMQSMWAKVLNINPQSIGVDDSFLHLGGNSITAMKLVGEARKSGLQLRVIDIFRCNTIAELVSRQSSNPVQVEHHSDDIVLIEPSLKTELIRGIEALNINVNSTDIENIYPVTAIQEGYVIAGVVTQQFCSYFYIDVDTNSDILRLKQGYQQTLQNFPVLRTCFFRLQEKVWQVVLHKLEGGFRVQDVDGDLDECFRTFCLKDTSEFLPIQPPFAFVVLRNTTQGMRLVVRMSHAQYDGISLPIIYQSLLDGEKKMASPTPSFTSFISYISRRRSQAIAYWTQLLQGACPTSVQGCVGRPGNIRTPKHIQLDSNVQLPYRSDKVTPATLVSTAWAVLLSSLSRSQDVVYSHYVAGRNSVMQGIEDIVGCCLNIVLVRVKFAAFGTPAELLQGIQEQYLAMGEADSLGLTDIVKHCTNWGPESLETCLQSTVHHGNVDENPEIQTDNGPLRVQEFQNEKYPSASIAVVSRVKGDCINLEINTSTLMMTEETATLLLSSLVDIVEKLINRMDMPLSSWMADINVGNLV